MASRIRSATLRRERSATLWRASSSSRPRYTCVLITGVILYLVLTPVKARQIRELALFDAPNRVRDQVRCALAASAGLNDENSRGKVQNVRGVVMSVAHPVA